MSAILDDLLDDLQWEVRADVRGATEINNQRTEIARIRAEIHKVIAGALENHECALAALRGTLREMLATDGWVSCRSGSEKRRRYTRVRRTAQILAVMSLSQTTGVVTPTGPQSGVPLTSGDGPTPSAAGSV